MKKFLLFLAALMFCLTVSACGPKDESSKTTIKLSKTLIELQQFTTELLAATVEPQKDVTWTSSNNEVATVSDNGLVSARIAGTAVIKAAADGAEAFCTVKVTANAEQPTLVPTSDSVSILLEDDLEFSAALYFNGNKVDAEIAYVVNDITIAQYSNEKIAAKAIGETTITISAVWFGSTYRISIPIIVQYDASVTISKTDVTLQKPTSEGVTLPDATVYVTMETLTAEVFIKGKWNEGAAITWNSEDSSVAAVSQNGEIFAVGVGETEVLATYKDSVGEVVSKCKVKVVLPKADIEDTPIVDKVYQDTFSVDVPTSVPGQLERIFVDGKQLESENRKFRLDSDWVQQAKEGKYDVVYQTADCLYGGKLEITSQYEAVSMSTFDRPANESDGQKGMSAVLSESSDIIGAGKAYRYESILSNIWTNLWSDDDFMSTAKNYDYAQFKLYWKEGTELGLYTSVDGFRWFAGNKPALIHALYGETGKVLDNPVKNEWMTVVLDLKHSSMGNARFGFSSNVAGTVFYVDEFRLYRQQKWNTLSVDYDQTECSVAPNQTISVPAISSVYTAGVPTKKYTISWSTDSDLISVEFDEDADEWKIKGLSLGEARVIAHIALGRESLEIPFVVKCGEILDDISFNVHREKDYIVNVAGLPQGKAIKEITYNGEIISEPSGNAIKLTAQFTQDVEYSSKDNGIGYFVRMETTDGDIYFATLYFVSDYDCISFDDFGRIESNVTVTPMDNPTGEDAEIVGDRKGVYRYSSAGNSDDWSNMWVYRRAGQTAEDFLTEVVNGYKYVQFSMYWVSGEKICLRVGNSVDWTAAGVQPECVIRILGATGKVLERPVKNEWITVVLDVSALKALAGSSGRFGFTSKDNANFYVGDCRLYTEAITDAIESEIAIIGEREDVYKYSSSGDNTWANMWTDDDFVTTVAKDYLYVKMDVYWAEGNILYINNIVVTSII